jgi:hypothetical protein
MLDGVTLSKYASAEGFYVGGQDYGSVYVPDQGRQVQIGTPNASLQGSVSVPDCASYGPSHIYFSLHTLDNGWAPPGLPSVWQGLSFLTCTPTAKDVMTHLSVAFTSLSTSHATGTFDVQIEGGGLRAGSTLHVFGDFDTDLMQ